MIVFQCDVCDYASVSKKYTCPKCMKGKLAEIEVSSKGKVYSFTNIHIAPVEFTNLAPYTIALIQLDEVNAKVTVRMEQPVQIGDAVDMERIEDGAFIYQKAK